MAKIVRRRALQHGGQALHNGGQARLRVRRRFLPLAYFLPGARFLITVVLIVSLVIAGVRFVLSPPGASALDFTPHVVGTKGSLVGLNGTAVGDMDGDGDMDIVIVDDYGVKVFSQQSDKKFTEHIVGDVKSDRIYVLDLDNDGQLDILVNDRDENGARWYRNEGGLVFTDFAIVAAGTGKGVTVAAGDINRDGYPDVVTATVAGELISLRRWMNNGSGTFTPTVLSTNSGVTAIAIGDVDGNGYKDIVTGGTQGLQRWRTADGDVWSRIDIDDTQQNKSSIVLKDVNQDEKVDIVTGDVAKDKVAYYRNVDNSAFQRTQLDFDIDASTVQVIDLDEDGNEDIVAAGQDDNTVYWLRNDGSDNFTQKILANNLQSVFSFVVADIDDDNDFDLVTGDFWRGTLYWYERLRTKPEATAPGSFTQSGNGGGLITFTTTISNPDYRTTNLRVQYSLDGDYWYKPWLTKVTASLGSTDLKNSNGYQVGTSNPVDTDVHDSVKLTMTWDTKSVENTGGPIVGDINTVRLRIIPRDSGGFGEAAVSSLFRVDNQAPQNLQKFAVSEITADSALLTWNTPSDSSAFTFKIFYDTDAKKVSDRTSQVWDADDDGAMNDIEATGTTITGLTEGKTYTFQLLVKDSKGNEALYPSTTALIAAAADPTPTPLSSVTPTPTSLFGASPTPLLPSPTPTFALLPTPTLEPTATPFLTTLNNLPPAADAGIDQVVNPSALVILDATASRDPNGDSLVYIWKQLSGPPVNLLSERTATPSFAAGGENETYIFSLTVRDPRGASSVDTVTVATKTLPASLPVVVETIPVAQTDETSSQPAIVTWLLRPVDLILFVISLFLTAVSVMDRLLRSWRGIKPMAPALLQESSDSPRGRVLHYRTGEAIAGAQVFVYSADGKLRTTLRTNERGEFPTLFPAGEYTLGVKVQGFTFAPTAARAVQPSSGILYTGGALSVRDGNVPLSMVVPMKPSSEQVGSLKARLLHFWQAAQYTARILSWPVFLTGALLNTVLIFWTPSALFLVIEVLYVLLVIVKVSMEVRLRPAYGLVRDAITHVPLDLAVVRLYEQGTNRLVMTRVANSQGRFFALPPSGTYTVTVSKQGYAVFSKQNVAIAGEQDSVLQITTDLMPVAPRPGLSQAQAALLA